jgi:AAA family ATP:ADP antiporter
MEAGFARVWVARSFFVWLSVFNLFVVSVFWSFMADIWSTDQSRRLFGIISAGGSTGAFLGPVITSVLVVPMGFENLLLLSALLLAFSVYCIHRLRLWSLGQESDDDKHTAETSQPLGGSAFGGIRLVVTTPYLAAIAASMVCATFLGGAMYMYMAELISVAFPDNNHQTRVFALIDAVSNALSFIGQLLVVRFTVKKLGIGMTLAFLPLVSVVAFALLAANPVFMVIAVFQVLRRGLAYGLAKPASDMLYSVVSRESKYKAKNFIETAVWRGGDVVATWTIRSLAGIGLTGVALVCVPIGIVWGLLAFWIGRDYGRRDRALETGQV